MVSLAIGLLPAVPAGLLSWLVLRRGFPVGAVSAGLAPGMPAGVEMLELHCPNFEAAHVLVWHMAGAAGERGIGSPVRLGVRPGEAGG